MQPSSSTEEITAPRPAAPTTPRGPEADALLRRAPMGYLWNQIGSLWLFASSFLFNVVITRSLTAYYGDTGGPKLYGLWAIALTLYNTAIYAAAFGMEDAATVFVPRALAEGGRAAAGSIIRRTLVTRIVGVTVVAGGLIALYLGLDGALAAGATGPLRSLGDALTAAALTPLIVPLALYMAGTGLMNLLSAIFTSILRTRLTFAVNGMAQLVNIVAAFVVLHYSGDIVGLLWVLTAIMWATAAVYGLLLLPYLTARDPGAPAPPFAPVLQLGWAAWITNLISGALLKQSVVWIMGAAAITFAAQGYFNVAFQLTHAAAFLLIAGLGGVGMAAMSAAYSGSDRPALGTAWRAVSKVQILLAVPILAFCFIHAQGIATILYGAPFAAVGPLMQLFLLFNIAQRLAGGGSHQAALYVIGRQRMALFTQVVGIAVTVGLAVVLVPSVGPLGGAAGALVAVGVGQVGVEVWQLALAWRSLQRKYPLRFGIRVIAALVPPTALIWFVRPASLLNIPAKIGPLPANSLANLVLSGIVFVVVLVVCLWIAKPIEHEDVELLAQTNPRLRPVLAPFAGGPPRPASAPAP